MFKDVTEIRITRFADCPLGKLAESSSDIANDLDIDESIIEVIECYKNCPIENGTWTGERGDSMWQPDLEYIPQKFNLEEKTWKEILDKYEIDGIEFKNGEPDFSEVSLGTVEIKDFGSNRTDNFDKADIELAKQMGCRPEEVKQWRKKNQYTWHECKDMKTMQLVPSIIHGNITHSGGIAIAKAEGIDN